MTNSLSILYVEDSEVAVEVLKRSFERYCTDISFTLDVATTVTEAIALFDSDQHAAALIDWNLPDGDGTEVAEHIRDLHSTLPVIFLSAVFTDEHYQEAGKYTPGDCLKKDHSQSFVDRIVQHILVQGCRTL